MTTYEQDPDIVRWGLHLLIGDPYSNFGYCGTANQHDVNIYNGEYIGGSVYGIECAPVENDEVAAHAQLSQFAVVDASESLQEEEHFEASDYPQDWLSLSMNNLDLGYESGRVEEDMESSSSNSGEKSYDGELSGSLELPEDYSDEVGKRLNQMVPIPHVPRTNGEIPSIDEATTDHQRLLDRLQLYDLIEFKVQGDGNCQFRALSDQFYRSPEHHKFVRQQVINQLKSQPEIYEGYVPMAYSDYLDKLSQDGQWGDHVTLQAAADSYGVKIFVITSFKDTCYIEILPNVQKSARVIFLSFWAEVHYNSIYPEGG
ncbi:hypothetical protein MRB53_032215 [Persea americana]|uniref:Uncharacterized protein n=1 Tax=Persea americana TaxID=3435 RepID=A0ACC2KR96_PERAE|nr:hypothetical protein MRB53_032215 [Persea americana]